jgi:hypothetical protein
MRTMLKRQLLFDGHEGQQVKPVNLNQLLFHEKSDCLSFFLSPVGNHEFSAIDAFIEDMLIQLKLQDKTIVAKILEKDKSNIKRILKSHPDQSHGFFLSQELKGYIILQNRIGPYCMIGQTFHVRPVLEELFVNPEFLIVNISLYDIKIFRGDFHQLEVIQQYEFDQLPKNFIDSEARVFAPQYLGPIPYKSLLALKTIAGKVKDMILYESLPVVVTGLDEMKTTFLRYFHDTSGIITHFNDDFYERSCIEILDRCKEFRFAITDYYSAQLKERLKRMMKSRRILTDLGEIIKATYSGKVVHLVIPPEQKIWGKIDSETGEFTIHKKIGKTSIDILNELAEEVIKQGGKIQILGVHFFPYNANVLAILKGEL